MNNYITTALPYANGDLHWGHFFEAVIADVYSQHQNIPLISGDDQHGAAITLYAEKHQLNITNHIQHQYDSHLEQYKKLGINFTFFGKTSSKFHQQLVLYFYEKLKFKNFIFNKKTISWFDSSRNQFLPDRYVRGTCPHCGKENVYPHVCEYCNQHFDAEQLLNPISSLSNTIPILKETEHLFINTELFFNHLSDFCEKLNFHDSVKKKILDNSLSHLKEIDISRDLPYFGIQIPDKPLAFYVWFDAPIGYLSFILEKISNENPTLIFNDLIELLPNIELEHIIGKDIVYFHTFFWLNLLTILDLPLPKKIHVHGWLTQDNGEKFAKSNGDKLDLNNFNDNQIDAIRLYFSSLYDGSIHDNCFSVHSCEEFYNSFIVGKFVNIYSRISKLLEKNNIKSIHINEKSKYSFETEVINNLNEFHLKNTLKTIFDWIDSVNNYIQINEPWKKNPEELLIIGTESLNEFKLIAKYIGLFCPYLKKNLQKIDYANISHIHLTSKIKI